MLKGKREEEWQGREDDVGKEWSWREMLKGRRKRESARAGMGRILQDEETKREHVSGKRRRNKRNLEDRNIKWKEYKRKGKTEKN